MCNILLQVTLLIHRAWQPDSNGTGGMVDDDWMTIRWDKVDSLSGGTTDWPQGLGLSPWYLATYNKTAPTFYETEATNPFLSSTASKRAPGPMLPGETCTPATCNGEGALLGQGARTVCLFQCAMLLIEGAHLKL